MTILDRRTGRVAVGALATALALTACGSAGSDDGGDAATSLDVATMTLPQSLDPAVANGSALPFFQAVYDSLLEREPDGSYQPQLATDWEWDEARTALTLTLRDDVTFDSGTPLDAAAVKANMERFAAGTGAKANWLAGVTGIDVVDATHLVVHLDTPDPAFEYYLSDAAGLIADPASFDDPDTLSTTPAGTGPYELDPSTVIGTRWVYTRADDYWGDEPDFDTITISYFDNETAIVNGLKTGQIDTAVIQDANQQLSLEGAAGLTAQDFDIDVQGIMLFDRAGVVTPELSDVRVRQAINYAIDRGTMLTQIRQDKGDVTGQMFGPASEGYSADLDDAYAYDPKKARALLAEAGLADGFELKLPLMRSLVPDALQSSLTADLAAVGITLTWVDVDQGDALRRVFVDREFSGLVMNIGQMPIDWLVAKDLVVPGTFNPFGYSDDTVAALLPELQATPAADAAEVAGALNQHLVDDAWFVPFYRMTYTLVTSADVEATPEVGMAVPAISNYRLAD